MLSNSRNENRADRTAILWREIGSTDVIRFETSSNLTLDDFVMALNNGGTVPTDPEYAGRIVIKNDRFMVEIKEVNGVRYFEFTAFKVFEAAATDNPSTLTVTVPKSRIKFEITILQRDASPYDWIGGGDTETELGE
jgi:hypothetical protein